MSSDIGFSIEELEELYVVFKVRGGSEEECVLTQRTNTKISWKGHNDFSFILNPTHQEKMWCSVICGASKTGPVTSKTESVTSWFIFKFLHVHPLPKDGQNTFTVFEWYSEKTVESKERMSHSTENRELGLTVPPFFILVCHWLAL